MLSGFRLCVRFRKKLRWMYTALDGSRFPTFEHRSELLVSREPLASDDFVVCE